MTTAQTAAVIASVLIAAVAVFQLALALGAPLGAAVLGGRAPTAAGVLTPPFRALALVQALVLVVLGWVLLARTDLVAIPLLTTGAVRGMTWAILAFLVLNTAANLSAPHPLERWGMGSTTLVLSLLTLGIALSP